MGSDGEKAKSKKRGSQTADGKTNGQDGAEFSAGDAVLVEAVDDKGTFSLATVVRRHMNGEFTVEYTDTGKTEKYVKPGRLQPAKKRAASKAGAQSASASTSFDKGEIVMYRNEDTKKKWRDGVVKMSRGDDGTVDVVDTETQRVVKKVPHGDVKKKKQTNREDPRKSGDDASTEEAWSVGDRVEYQCSGDHSWQRGRVVKRRKDGTFDVSHESDDDEIAEKVPVNKLRKPRSKGSSTRGREGKKKGRSSGDESSDTNPGSDNGSSVRMRKGKRKVSTRSVNEDSEEDRDGVDSDSIGRNKKRADDGRISRPRRSLRQGMRFEQLRLHQLVAFEDDKGRSHRGYVKLLRPEDRACDIEHESDTDRVSKRVPASAIASVSMFSKLWGPTRQAQTYALNARVYYYTKEGTERKGFVIKIVRDDGKDVSYDIEDEIDGDITRKVPARKLRPVPWINYPSLSLPTLPSLPGLPAMPSMPSMPSWPTVLRKGMQVRVRQRDKDSGRVTWHDGVILRLKKDAMCVVECSVDDATKKLTVKNGDVRPKFSMPFAGISLPNLQLPQGLYPPKSFVEVLADGKASVYLGTVVSVDEAAKTYTILYADGRKEKKVASHRVRLCLRKLRIGTEVEMIVQGPCKEVSKLDGEVAWVHRDEKVAVRIHGGHNDVFAEVCPHAIMIDGQPAFAAPLSSSWLSLGGFYTNLALEVVVFLWLCFGLCVEIGEMVRLQNDTAPGMLTDPQHMTELYMARETNWTACRHEPVNGTSYLTIPTSFMQTDRTWLTAMIVLKIVLTIACVSFSCRLVHNKISAIQDNYIDVKEFQQDRVLRRHFARVVGFTLITCFGSIVVYASMLNRFESFCLFEKSDFQLDKLSLHVDVLAVHTPYATTIDMVLALTAKSIFNLFRGVALFLLVFAFPNAAVLVRLCLWLPVCIGVTALISSMGIAALHIFYHVQRVEIVENAAATLTPQVDWALIAIAVALWFNIAIVRLVVATGTYFDTVHARQADASGDLTDDLLDQAERGEFGLQAKREALYSRVERKQEELGVCKLSVLRVQRHCVVHTLAMIVGIISTCTLQGIVAGEASTVVTAALTLHLLLCILWLIVVLLSSLAAIVVKREVPELLTYILDV